jgi:nitrite reductase/ring-hydroxylating ferredoxin subunit
MLMHRQDGGSQALACTESGIARARYTSRDFLALEYDRIFARTWQVAAREEELRNPGDFVEYVIGDRSALIVRGRDGEIRAMHNSCPHRGTRLAHDCGRFAGEIRCPYHGWRWKLDGTNSFVLDRAEFGDIESARLDLRPLACDRWGGFVFVNFAADAEPLLDYLDPLPDLLGPYHPERMRLTSRQKTIVPCNWKVVIDAFNEAYHLLGTHPEMLDYIDDVAMEYQPLERHTNSTGTGHPTPSPHLGIDPGSVDQSALLAMMVQGLIDSMPGYFRPDDIAALEELKRAGVPDGMTAGAYYLARRREGAAARGLDWSQLRDQQVLGGDTPLIFPTLLGPIVGGGWFAYRARPNRWDPSTAVFEHWTMEELPEGAEWPATVELVVHDDYLAHDWGTVLNQDFANFAAVQKGLENPDGPPLLWHPRQEACVRRFHEIIDDHLFGEANAA